MTQSELDKILGQLSFLGANKEELELWRNLYPTLPESRQLELDKNFKQELEQLQK